MPDLRQPDRKRTKRKRRSDAGVEKGRNEASLWRIRAWVSEYVARDFNGVEAALAVYGCTSRQSAATQSRRLLMREDVRELIKQEVEQRIERTRIDSEWVLRQAVEVYNRVVQKVRPALHSSGKQLHDPDTGEPLYRFDAHAALKALELIGKHIDVKAWERETVEINVHSDQAIVDAREYARRRRLEQSEDAEFTELPKHERIEHANNRPSESVAGEKSEPALSRKSDPVGPARSDGGE